ncbi:MAG TPA: endonuclease/exonuclease/phosphatase family protein [Sunxiuqinia sp.]|nr:endonuclease/exonuclease/phosphatase family protein [Sunxiuqinia sp.]
MKNQAFLIILLVVFLASCSKNPLKRKATVVFYNTENLFDTIDDPKINDDEFLPQTDKHWNTQRYDKKLNDLAHVIASIDTLELPELIGLAEIENQRVLQDLIHTKYLAKGDYQIVHVDSPDKRGIDVALLYRKDEFKVLSFEALHVDPGFATRDILHVVGKLDGDKIHVFVNHWPSRWGGQEKSEPNRIVAAQTLKKKVDEILAKNPNAKIIIVGDMNDEPDNKSLLDVLGAKSPASKSELHNLMIPLDEQNKGTESYRGQWFMLDNIVVSNAVLHGKGFTASDQLGQIFHAKWMEYTNKYGKTSPNRTYGGPNYYGGISDHFPVYLKLSEQ